MSSPKIRNILSQQKYHSFLIAQTDDKELAEKWEYYVLSSGGQLLMSTQETKPNNKYEYNIGADTISYELESLGLRKVILAQGNWLKGCLGIHCGQNLRKNGYINFESVDVVRSIKFFYYVGNLGVNNSQILNSGQYDESKLLTDYGVDQFIEISPRYLLEQDCLVFEVQNQLNREHRLNGSFFEVQSILQKREMKLKLQMFKLIRGLKDRVDYQGQGREFYNYKSQYALLSDRHFLNCLMRGKKSIGSYMKQGQFYVFWMDKKVYNILEKIYVTAKL